MSVKLRRWLQKTPHPVTVRAEMADGQEKTVRIGDTSSRWRDAEAALSTAIRCEAFDSTDATLRVWETDDSSLLERSVVAVERAPQGKSELQEFARILSDSCDRAALRSEGAYRLAFEQQCLLVNVLSSRLQTLEKAWHQLLMSQEAEKPNDDPNAAMVSALLAGVPGLMNAAPKNGVE